MTEKDEKRVFEEKRFAIITKESIKLIAEAAGFADIPDDVAGLLGEDVSYRLREVTQNSTQYLKHGKRKRLTTDDFNKALTRSDVQAIHGYRSPDPLSFRQVKDGDIFFVEDVDVNFCNIAFNSYVPKNSGDTTIKAHWLAVEGISKVTSNSQQTQAKTNVKHEISEELQQYYEHITNAILGADIEAMKVALTDLRSNPQIVPLLPYFVNFVSNGVKTVSHDISQLTRLLHTVRSLINNASLYLEPQPYLNLLVQGVIYCLLEPLAASINPTNDHWSLRDYAARILASIVECWSSNINHLQYNTIKTLKEVLYDHTKPFCCHYGAVVGLSALGIKALEDILIPHLPSYWPHITGVIEDVSFENMVPKADAHKVYGAILLAVEFLIKKQIEQFEEEYLSDDKNKISQENKAEVREIKTDVQVKSEPSIDQSANLQTILHRTVGQFYSDMYEYFGDSLSMRLPDLNEKVSLRNQVFKPKKKEIYVSLADPEAAKSGDDLLEEFMEQVRIQEKIDKERREQEKIELERLEEERKIKEEEDRVRREEEERLAKIRHAKREKERQKLREEEKRLEKLRREELELEYKRQHEEEKERERLLEIQKKIDEEKKRKQEERKRRALEKQMKLEEERRRKMLEKQRKNEEELEMQREKERQRERLMLERQREKERLQQEELKAERLRRLEEGQERHSLEEIERDVQRQMLEEKQRQEALERQLAIEKQKQQELKRKSQEYSDSPKHRKYDLQETSSHFRQHDLKVNLDHRQLSDFRERQQYMEEDGDSDEDYVPPSMGHYSNVKDEPSANLEDSESLPGPSLRQTTERIKRKSMSDLDIYYESSDSEFNEEDLAEETTEVDKTTHMDLAVKRISDKGSIKLKITRRPKVLLQKRPKATSSKETSIKETSLKDIKSGKKKKQTFKSTKPYDAFEFESDPEDYKPIQTFGNRQYYSSEGDESSDGTGQRKPLTLKLKVKDSKDFASE